MSHPQIIFDNQQIPIKLKALELRENNFNIEDSIQNIIKHYSNQFFDEEAIKNYKIIPFIDDFDLLRSSEKTELKDKLKKYCDDNSTHFVITYSKSEISYDDSIKTIKIHNFNIKQIESFIEKFFEGTSRAAMPKELN